MRLDQSDTGSESRQRGLRFGQDISRPNATLHAPEKPVFAPKNQTPPPIAQRERLREVQETVSSVTTLQITPMSNKKRKGEKKYFSQAERVLTTFAKRTAE